MKILIIEDEEKLRNELKTFLKSHGYEVVLITNFTEVESQIESANANLILLDINLPNINGEFILKNIRKTSDIPIIMVTSKNTEMDELLSINYGADDFITKPYNSEILLARIERLLTRKQGNEIILTYENVTIDLSKSLMKTSEKQIDLSRNEIKILAYLLKNKGTIISRDMLISYLWDNNEYIDDNTLTVNINRLRNKFLELGIKDIIITKRSQGYIIL